MTNQAAISAEGSAAHLPEPFLKWFQSRGWSPRAHQIDLLARAQAGRSALLIAPTGAGKTLAGFLPSLVDLASRPKRRPGEAYRGVHTLYISPLKAHAVDIERNLGKPVEDWFAQLNSGKGLMSAADYEKLRKVCKQTRPLDHLRQFLTGPESALFQKSMNRGIADITLQVLFGEVHNAKVQQLDAAEDGTKWFAAKH